MADAHMTTADIIAEMRKTYVSKGGAGYCGEVWIDLLRYADRLEAAHRRERGDCAKLREAAEFVAHIDDNGYTSHDVQCAIDKARAAFSAPPRNCDVGTVKEQRVRFEAWCEKQPERYCKACAECPTQRFAINCFCKWAQMPCEEGGDK